LTIPKNAEIARVGNFLTQQTSDNKAEIMRLTKQNQELLEEKKLREVQISLLKAEVQNLDEGGQDSQEEVHTLRRELERARAESREYSEEVERLSKKLSDRNNEHKLYKVWQHCERKIDYNRDSFFFLPKRKIA
jgi:chromosome segregation ATPase